MIDTVNVKSIYLFSKHVDMRLGLYRIESILAMSFTPIELLHCAFIFVSKNQKTIKIYYEDEYGKWLMINKLAYSSFQIPDSSKSIQLSPRDLEYLLKGVAIISQRNKEVSI